jgi:hypothetical protein
VPVLRALAELRRARTPGTVALYAAIFVAMAVVASVPACPALQRELARTHQARPSSLALWAGLQVVPKMYSFAHRIWFSREPLSEFVVMRGDPGVERETMWVNHSPIRAARFEGSRAAIVEHGEDVEVLVRTAYRGRSWVSRFVVRVDGDGLVLEDVTP